MKLKSKRLLKIIGFLVAFALVSSSAFAGLPTEQIKSTVDRALVVLKDPLLKPAAKLAERRDQVEQIDGTYADVGSKIFTSRGEEYSINYKVHLVSTEWKVDDVVAENISLVNNYRSQFNRVISHESYKELVRRLKDKAEFTPIKQ